MNLAKHLSTLAGLATLGLAVPAMADFNYPDFSNTAGLTLVGSSVQDSNRILLTPTDRSQAGAVWATDRQNVAGSFDASMTIHIEDRAGGGADGIALVIQNTSPTAIGGSGGAMGFAGNPVFGLPGIPNSIAIALDMWDNNIRDWSEAGDDHVTVQTRGLDENSILLPFSLGNAAIADPSDGSQHQLRVVYNPGDMKVYFDGVQELDIAVNLSTLLNLQDGTGEFVGVTAATGAGQDAQTHVLDKFQFTTVPTPGTASLLFLGGAVGLRRRRKA